MRIFLLLFLTFCVSVSQAQLRLGIQAGYSRVKWASINPTSSAFETSYTTSALRGFQMGVVAEVNLSDKLFLRPALFVSGKGTTLDRQSWVDTRSRGIWLQYVEVPVTLVYQVILSRKVTGFVVGLVCSAGF